METTVTPKAPMTVVVEKDSVWLKDANGVTFAASTNLADAPFLWGLADVINGKAK